MTVHMCLEGGASRSVAGLYTAQGDLLAACEVGPTNPLAYGDVRCLSQICEAARLLHAADAGDFTLSLGLAGAGDAAWRSMFCGKLAHALPLSRVRISSDLDPLLHANADGIPAVMAIIGTGSSVLSKTAEGDVTRLGGRGHVLGDEGSAYALAVRGLRAAAFAFDNCGDKTSLLHVLPKALGVVDINALVPWSLLASKREVAAMASLITQEADAGDAVALRCVQEEAALMARQIDAARLRLGNLPLPPSLFLNGGLVENSSHYRSALLAFLLEDGFSNHLCPPPIRGHAALLPLALAVENPPWSVEWNRAHDEVPNQPSTELNTDINLDELPTRELVLHFCNADQQLSEVLRAELDPIALCVESAAHALVSGGRIIYVGAGTSGRLGALDASECPPTFGVSPDRVIAVIAGGSKALTQSVEGAEDDMDAAVSDMIPIKLSAEDFVIGIAASGTTPYTLAALQYAKERGAHTALLCCNPAVGKGADILVRLHTGPEVLPGSTRLKAGTATKMTLNIISTGAMAKAGYIYRGRMVHMKPINAKLKQRAVRMVSDLAQISQKESLRILETTAWEIPVALIMLKLSLSQEEATERLRKTNTSLLKILGSS